MSRSTNIKDYVQRLRKRHYTLVLAPYNTRHSLTVRFHLLRLYIFIGIFLIITVSVSLMGVEFASRLQSQKRLSYLKLSVENAEGKLDELDKRRVEIQEQNNNHIDSDDNLRLIHDMTPIDSDERKVGVGGPISSVGHLMKFNSDKRVDNLELAIRQAELQKDSYNKIIDTVRRERHILDHTPSVKPCMARKVSGFGWRRNPLFGGVQFHKGLDLAAITGTPIVAPADGVIKFAGMRGGYGYTVFVDHGYGFETRYGHCSRLVVKDGDQVKRGDLIAYIGSTGWSLGPHLHYEVMVNGIHVDPERYILPDYHTE